MSSTTTTKAGKAPKTGPAIAKTLKPKEAKSEHPTKAKKLSALDAAAQVLTASKEPMTCGEMIEAMTARKLWISPGGKTPLSTLASAILREISTKGKDSRFSKTGRGLFTAKC